VNVTLPPLAGPLADVWPLLFTLADERPTGWCLVGSQMVILHAAAHGVERPLTTEDADIVVDIRELPTTNVARWLLDQQFQLQDVSPDGIGHRFRRGGIVVDILAIDHADASDRTTIPPARTVAVPGGRRAMGRVIMATVTTGKHAGALPVPDWLGSVLLKARAVLDVVDERAKHLQDLALLLGLPEDIPGWTDELAGQDRKHLRRAGELLDEATWRAVGRAIDVRNAQAALALLT